MLQWFIWCLVFYWLRKIYGSWCSLVHSFATLAVLDNVHATHTFQLSSFKSRLQPAVVASGCCDCTMSSRVIKWWSDKVLQDQREMSFAFGRTSPTVIVMFVDSRAMVKVYTYTSYHISFKALVLSFQPRLCLVCKSCDGGMRYEVIWCLTCKSVIWVLI